MYQQFQIARGTHRGEQLVLADDEFSEEVQSDALQIVKQLVQTLRNQGVNGASSGMLIYS